MHSAYNVLIEAHRALVHHGIMCRRKVGKRHDRDDGRALLVATQAPQPPREPRATGASSGVAFQQGRRVDPDVVQAERPQLLHFERLERLGRPYRCPRAS